MVWMDGKAALKKTLPKSWIHTVSDFFGEAQMQHFCLSQMCFTIRLDTIEKIYTFTSFYQLVFGTSTKDTSPLPRHENISIIYPPPSLLQFATQKILVPKELVLVASLKRKRKNANEKWMQQSLLLMSADNSCQVK